jgi:hypothetical protein
MILPKRDIFATALVVLAGALYLSWAAGSAPPGLGSTRATGLVILGLGFAASASAVVPGFERLVHDDKPYMAVMSLIGLVALVGGVVMLVTAGAAWLGLMMGTMGVLWLVSTVHHTKLAWSSQRPTHGRGALGVS